jgi:arylsulfatase A-like enzyme
VLDAAGVSIPEAMQGESLLPIVTNEVSHWRDALYYHYYEYPGIHAVKRHYGIRTDQYKLIHFYYDIDVWELYNLEADPDELKNVYEDEAYSGIRSQLHKRLKALRAEYGDSDSLTQQMLERDLAK